MDYTEIKIYIEREQIEPLTCALADIGIGGFVVEDPEDFREFLQKKKGYEWDYVDESLYALETAPVSVTFYIEDTLEGLDVLDQVTYIGQDFPIDRLEIGSVREIDWRDKWKEYFKPVKVTNRLVVKPSWETYEKASEEELIIEIDPGMAFGTGTHPTTTLCLRALEQYIRPGTTAVLDVGSGSGILSIAASLLGAKEILGIEIDPQAVEVGCQNVQLNRLSDRISIREGNLTEGLSQKFDLAVANLMADLVMMLSKDVGDHLVTGGIFISSGILVEKKEQVVWAIRNSGFEVVEIPEEGEWCAVIARKK